MCFGCCCVGDGFDEAPRGVEHGCGFVFCRGGVDQGSKLLGCESCAGVGAWELKIAAALVTRLD